MITSSTKQTLVHIYPTKNCQYEMVFYECDTPSNMNTLESGRVLSRDISETIFALLHSPLDEETERAFHILRNKCAASENLSDVVKRLARELSE